MSNLNSRYQNLHTHTSHCDGKLTAGEMVEAALEKGGGSIGFSEHSYLWFEQERYSLVPSRLRQYISEVKALKAQYEGQIEIFLGMEQDYFSESIPERLDYIIGSVHFVQHDGKYITIDNSLDVMGQVRDEHFGGDFLAVAESYFETMSGVAVKTGADIIGHFDIIAKQNEGGRLFDETNPRYIKAAISAMESILERCNLFEINTGAMYRVGRSIQYPSEFLLRELARRGGEIVLSSDSHDAPSLYWKFDEMGDVAKHCGFKNIKRLTKDGFIDEKL